MQRLVIHNTQARGPSRSFRSVGRAIRSSIPHRYHGLTAPQLAPRATANTSGYVPSGDPELIELSKRAEKVVNYYGPFGIILHIGLFFLRATTWIAGYITVLMTLLWTKGAVIATLVSLIGRQKGKLMADLELLKAVSKGDDVGISEDDLLDSIFEDLKLKISQELLEPLGAILGPVATQLLLLWAHLVPHIRFAAGLGILLGLLTILLSNEHLASWRARIPGLRYDPAPANANANANATSVPDAAEPSSLPATPRGRPPRLPMIPLDSLRPTPPPTPSPTPPAAHYPALLSGIVLVTASCFLGLAVEIIRDPWLAGLASENPIVASGAVHGAFISSLLCWLKLCAAVTASKIRQGIVRRLGAALEVPGIPTAQKPSTAAAAKSSTSAAPELSLLEKLQLQSGLSGGLFLASESVEVQLERQRRERRERERLLRPSSPSPGPASSLLKAPMWIEEREARKRAAASVREAQKLRDEELRLASERGRDRQTQSGAKSRPGTARESSSSVKHAGAGTEADAEEKGILSTAAAASADAAVQELPALESRLCRVDRPGDGVLFRFAPPPLPQSLTVQSLSDFLSPAKVQEAQDLELRAREALKKASAELAAAADSAKAALAAAKNSAREAQRTAGSRGLRRFECFSQIDAATCLRAASPLLTVVPLLLLIAFDVEAAVLAGTRDEAEGVIAVLREQMLPQLAVLRNVLVQLFSALGVHAVYNLTFAWPAMAVFAAHAAASKGAPETHRPRDRSNLVVVLLSVVPWMIFGETYWTRPFDPNSTAIVSVFMIGLLTVGWIISAATDGLKRFQSARSERSM